MTITRTNSIFAARVIVMTLHPYNYSLNSWKLQAISFSDKMYGMHL